MIELLKKNSSDIYSNGDWYKIQFYATNIFIYF